MFFEKMKNYIILYKGILINFFSLSLVKVINMAFPLILIPYIIKTVGIDNYGKISLYQVIMGYLALFGTYGSDITAPRSVAMSSKGDGNLSEVMSKVIFGRLVAIPLRFILMIAVIILYRLCTQESIAIIACFFSFALLISTLTNFSWFYQGIEKMAYVPVIYFCSQIIYFLLVYTYISTKEDYIYVMLYQGISEILVNITMGLYIVRKYNIKIAYPGYIYMLFYYRENFSIFVTNVSLASYKAASLPILQLFSNSYVLGVYSIINKISDILRQLLSNFFNVIYPRLCSIKHNELDKRRETLYSLYFPFLIFFVVLLIFVYAYSFQILNYFIKDDNVIESYISLFRLSLSIPLIVIFNIPSYLMLLVYDKRNAYTSVLILASVISIVLSFILARYFFLLGIIVATIIAELLITISFQYMYTVKYKNKLIS